MDEKEMLQRELYAELAIMELRKLSDALRDRDRALAGRTVCGLRLRYTDHRSHAHFGKGFQVGGTVGGADFSMSIDESSEPDQAGEWMPEQHQRFVTIDATINTAIRHDRIAAPVGEDDHAVLASEYLIEMAERIDMNGSSNACRPGETYGGLEVVEIEFSGSAEVAHTTIKGLTCWTGTPIQMRRQWGRRWKMATRVELFIRFPC